MTEQEIKDASHYFLGAMEFLGYAIKQYGKDGNLNMTADQIQAFRDDVKSKAAEHGVTL